MHDLDIEVRVSRWPAGANALVLEPVTIEPSGTYQLPVFEIPAPTGEGPLQLTQKGRVRLVVPQHLNARPFESKYAAEFVPQDSEQPVDVVGRFGARAAHGATLMWIKNSSRSGMSCARRPASDNGNSVMYSRSPHRWQISRDSGGSRRMPNALVQLPAGRCIEIMSPAKGLLCS